MCGNNNGISADDFRTPDGSIVKSGTALGDGWRAKHKKCPSKASGSQYCLAKDQSKNAFAAEACKVIYNFWSDNELNKE